MKILLQQYWRFYWPLALTGVAMVLAGQFQNGALARYPDAVTELAVFALAMGTFGPFQATLNFVSQMSNVFARSQQGQGKTLQFVMLACIVISLIFLGISVTSVGRWLLTAVYGIDTEILERVMEYLVFLCPLIFLNGIRQYFLGLLVQSRLTGRVTILNMVYLCTVIIVLVLGFNLGWRPVNALVGAQILGALIHLGVLYQTFRQFYIFPEEIEKEIVTFRELFSFFLPVTTTGVMFAISRPVLYALMGRTPDALISIAAMRVGFDFSFIFQSAANQFRHFFVTFGDDDIHIKQLFMFLIAMGLTLLMLLVAATPLSHFVLSDLIGVKAEVLAMSVEVILVMCLLPSIIILRNYFHGLLMHHRKTAGMAMGGILRVAGIYVLASLLLTAGYLNHVTATLVLLSGFVLETLVVIVIWGRVKS
jgi:Na+-driven multidrug efflux pump